MMKENYKDEMQLYLIILHRVLQIISKVQVELLKYLQIYRVTGTQFLPFEIQTFSITQLSQ